MISELYIFLANIAFVLFPCLLGLPIASYFFKQQSVSGKYILFPMSFLFGIAIFSLLGFIGFVLALSLVNFIYLNILVFLLTIVLLRKNISLKLNLDIFTCMLLLIVSIYVFKLFFIGSYQDPSSDSTRHLVFIQKILGENRLSITNFFYSKNNPYGMLNSVYSYNSIYILYAVVARIFDVSAPLLFFHQPSTVVTVFIFTLYSFAFFITGSKKYSLSFLILSLFYYTFYTSSAWFRILSCPGSIGLIGYLGLMGAIILFLKNGFSLFGIVIASLCGASLLCIHPQWWAFFLLGMCLLCAYCIFSRLFKNAFILFSMFIAMLCLSAPIIFFKFKFYKEAYSSLSTLTKTRNAHHFWHFGAHLFALKPSSLSKIIYFLLLLSVVRILLHVFLFRKKIYRQFANLEFLPEFMLLGYLFLLLCPLTAPILSESMSTGLVLRLPQVCLYWGGIVFLRLLFDFVQYYNINISRLKTSTTLTRKVIMGFVMVYFLSFSSFSNLSISNATKIDANYSHIFGATLSQLVSSKQFQQLIKQIPPGSSVLTDMDDSILAQRDVFIVDDLLKDLSINRTYNKLTQKFLKTKLDEKLPIKALNTLGAEYILLSPTNYNLSWMKLDGNLNFKKIAEVHISNLDFYSNRYVLYKVIPDSEIKSPLTVPMKHGQIQHHIIPAMKIKVLKYYSDIEPNGWLKKGNELINGKCCDTSNSLLWILPAYPMWFYVEFELDKFSKISRIEIMNSRYNSNYYMNGFAIYFSKDGKKYHLVYVKRLTHPLSIGKHIWQIGNINESAKYVKLAILSHSNTTLSEVNFYG